MRFSRGNVIECDFDAIMFDTILSTIPKMADIQSSEEDAKLAGVNAGQNSVMFGNHSNHGNHTILP
jgi:hypothetical protein